MAKTKTELEQHREEYYAKVAAARAAQQEGDFRKAIEFAVLSWPYVDGMMQYERKYEERTFDSIEAIDIFLTYAPLVFDFVNLEVLAALLKTQRRIEKNTSGDLSDALAKARESIRDAHQLWNHWEGKGELCQDEADQNAGVDADRWQWIADHWEKMGLIRLTRDGGKVQIEFCTRMDEPTAAKCPSCGVVGKAPKSKLLDDVNCPKCRARVQFVILAVQSTHHS
jgi:hypothetical protein